MIRPIFALFIRSLREDTRARFTPIMRATLVLIILLFIETNQRDFSRTNAPGLQVFLILMFVNLGGLVLGGITAFCSAITEEKEDETLGLLRMTNLNAVSILLGKSVSRFVSGALLLAAQIPFTMLCVTLGGISAATILKGYGILLCTLFLLCNLGLLMSVITKTTGIAVARTLFVGVIWYAALPYYFVVVKNARFGSPLRGPEFLHDLSAFAFSENPAVQLATLMYGPLGGNFPSISEPFLFHTIAGTACFLLAWALFGRFCSGVEDTAPRKEKAALGQKNQRFPRPGVRAIAWKDFWFSSGGRRALFVRYLCYGLLILSIVWSASKLESSSFRSQDVGGMFMFFALWTLAIELILASANLFGSERKSLTLSSLITLPISLGGIVRQKILGMLPSFIPAFTYLLIGALIAPSLVEDFFDETARARPSEFANLCYAGMHLILLPMLVCWLSLKLRRGGVPFALTIVFVWNVVVGALADMSNRETEFAWIVVLAFIILSILLGLVHWSLKLRRGTGKVAAVLAIVYVWKVLLEIVTDAPRRVAAFEWVGVLIFAVFSVVLGFKIARELPRVAAEE